MNKPLIRTPATYRRFYAAARAEVRAFHAAYEAEVADWFESGDGRPRAEGGRGYSFPRCVHGANMWVDYDIPCGDCEYGVTMTEEAMGLARGRFDRFCNEAEWLWSAPASWTSRNIEFYRTEVQRLMSTLP